MAFFLTFVVFAISQGEHAIPRPAAGVCGGLVVAVNSFWGGPFTGGAMNPARAFGPALASRDWNNHPIYWIGPLAGGLLAGWLCELIFAPRKRATRGR